MADTDQDRSVAPDTDTPKQEKIVKLRPTLFIGVGGTGMEVMLRVRRRILSAVWGTTPPVRLDSLADFPLAQFLHFDLDQGAVLDSGKAQTTDLMAELVKLTDEDRIIENFEIDRYCRSDGDLARFPYIEAWSPLTPKRIRELGIDPSKGAGQIRAIGRLYFFDKYAKIRDKIRNKLTWLMNGLSKDAQFGRLGLELEQSYRIVVIGSIAGGTGSGSFVDMGWLAGWQANNTVSKAEIELVLFLPTGFASATNKDRTEANGYAALMELETYMREGRESFEERWDAYEKPELNRAPYDQIYLVDSGNLAQLHTAEQRDVYDMVADALFEDFNSGPFADKKRSTAINQKIHKDTPFNAAVPRNRYGDMKLSFHKGYSAFGQAILDTQGMVKRDIRAHHWVSAMLKAFFGVASGDGGNRATDKQRDDFMVAHMHLGAQPFSDFPDFSSREVDLKLAAGEFYDYALTTDLLTDRHGATVAMMQQKVDNQLEQLVGGFEREQWPTQVREAVKQLEKDAVRDENAMADVMEDRVSLRRRELFDEITAKLRDQLYNYLDNKEFGGLEFVLSLVEQIKARLEDPHTGLVHAQATNAARYQEIKEALRTYEYERLLGNLSQTRGFGLFGAKDKQARVILDQLKVEVGNYLKFHLRAKAATEGAQLLRDLSKWLGERVDVDATGNARWNGLVGELQAGRQAVLVMLANIEQRVALLQEDVKKDHATYLRVDAAEREVPLPPARQLREWADEAFKDFGGSRRLFPMLQQPQLRSGLFAKLRHKAEAQMPADVVAGRPGHDPDPLVEALRAMPPVERHRRFSELLSRAMPWIDANLGREYTPDADQYQCHIGVGNADEWKQFQEELFAQTPTQAGITARQLSFFTAGIRGRAVCYTELSGIPLAVLRGLETWRTSYRKESERIPVHTHRDPTKFTHPCVPTTDELARLADDFKTFLLGVMLRVLVRDPSARVFPPGQYQFTIGRGDVRRMGNERAFRLNGLPPNFRQQIHDAVLARAEALDKTQLGALAALALAYSTDVYMPRLVPNETGAQDTSKGFASAVAEQLAGDLKNRARRKGATDPELQRIERMCLEARLAEWTDVVPDSDADAYASEVREVRDGDDPRLKRAVRVEFFTPGWLEANVLTSQVPPGVSPGGGPPLLQGGFSGPGAPPPPPPSAFQYYVVLNGQRNGPHPFAHLQHWIGSGQLPGSTLTWREGLADWVASNQVPELAVLFTSVPPPPLPSSGPPPVPGPKAAE
jgi:hypothetical protein